MQCCSTAIFRFPRFLSMSIFCSAVALQKTQIPVFFLFFADCKKRFLQCCGTAKNVLKLNSNLKKIPVRTPLVPKVSKTRGVLITSSRDQVRSVLKQLWSPKISRLRRVNAIFGVFRAPCGALHQNFRACGAKSSCFRSIRPRYLVS